MFHIVDKLFHAEILLIVGLPYLITRSRSSVKTYDVVMTINYHFQFGEF